MMTDRRAARSMTDGRAAWSIGRTYRHWRRGPLSLRPFGKLDTPSQKVCTSMTLLVNSQFDGLGFKDAPCDTLFLLVGEKSGILPTLYERLPTFANFILGLVK